MKRGERKIGQRERRKEVIDENQENSSDGGKGNVQRRGRLFMGSPFPFGWHYKAWSPGRLAWHSWTQSK